MPERASEPLNDSPRLVICRRGLAALAMTDGELEAVHRTMTFYDDRDVIPRLLATVEALRHAG